MKPRRSPRPTNASWQEGMRDAGPYLGLGAQILSAMLVFVGGGLWGDARLGTSPLLLIVGLAFAFGAIAAMLVRLTRTADRKGREHRVKPSNVGDDSAA